MLSGFVNVVDGLVGELLPEISETRSGGGESLGAGGSTHDGKRLRSGLCEALGTRDSESSDCRGFVARCLSSSANISQSLVDWDGTSRSVPELAGRYSSS